VTKTTNIIIGKGEVEKNTISACTTLSGVWNSNIIFAVYIIYTSFIVFIVFIVYVIVNGVYNEIIEVNIVVML